MNTQVVMTMIVEFVQNDCDSKPVTNRDGAIVGLNQKCYFHIPGVAFPVQGKIRTENPNAPGKYNYQPAFRVGKYGDLEVNPFENASLTPAKPEQIKSAS